MDTWKSGQPRKRVIATCNSATKKAPGFLTELPTIQISSKEIQELAAFKPQFQCIRSPGKTAILAFTELHFGMARMFESQNANQGSSHAVMVFKDIVAAISWLDES